MRLLTACRASLFAAVEQCVDGHHLSDLGHAVQTRVEADGFGVIRSLVGHGVGRRMHEDPQIPNYGPPGRGQVLRPGMTLAVEPMITASGETDVQLDEDDGWSIYSADHSLTAHYEHTVAVTDDGPLILTRHEGWSPGRRRGRVTALADGVALLPCSFALCRCMPARADAAEALHSLY